MPNACTRRHIILFLFIPLIAAWIGLWIATSRQFDKQIETWITAERKAKHGLSYETGRAGGSPLGVSRRFRNVTWKNGKGGSAQIEEITLTARVWCWRSVEADFQNATLTTPYLPDPSGLLTLQTEESAMGLVWNGAHEWTKAEISLSGLKLSRAGKELSSIEKLAIETKRPRPAPTEHKETGLTLSGEIKNLVIKSKNPLPFGDTVTQAGLNLRVMGAPPDPFNKASLAAWNDASGIVEIDDVTLEWNHPSLAEDSKIRSASGKGAPPPDSLHTGLNLTAKGTLALNNSLQPEGAFSARIKNREAVAKALVDTGWAALNEVELLNAALNLDTNKKQLLSSNVVPLSVQEGALFIGPARSIPIPPIPWPQ